MRSLKKKFHTNECCVRLSIIESYALGGGVSRILSWVIISLGPLLPTASSCLPKGSSPKWRNGAGRSSPSYLALLQTGFAVPARLPGTAVGSYPTISPLPADCTCANKIYRRFVFCGTFRRVSPPGSYPASCPVESGLSSNGFGSTRDHLLPLHTPIITFTNCFVTLFFFAPSFCTESILIREDNNKSAIVLFLTES